MESTLFAGAKLTFSEYLRCLNFPLWILWPAITKQLKESSFEILHPPVAPNSNILNFLRMSTLKGQIVLISFQKVLKIEANMNLRIGT